MTCGECSYLGCCNHVVGGAEGAVYTTSRTHNDCPRDMTSVGNTGTHAWGAFYLLIFSGIYLFKTSHHITENEN